MKKSVLFIPLIAVMFTACKKENVINVTDENPKAATVADEGPLMDQEELSMFFNEITQLEEGYSMDDFNYHEEYDGGGNLLATQMMAIYMNSAGDYLNVSIADFSKLSTNNINSYLAGKYFPVGTDIRWPKPTQIGIAASPNQGYILQTGTGVGAITLALQNPQSNPYSGLFSEPLAPTSGSFVRATTLGGSVSVAGWEVYDNATDAGMIILLVNGKYAVTIDGTAVASDIAAIMNIANQINFSTFPL